MFFPGFFDDAKTKEYYTLLKQWTVLTLEKVAGKSNVDELKKVESTLFLLLPPKSYSGQDGEEVQGIKAYERACAVMRQHQSKDPKRMTVLEFYEALEALKAQGKKQYELNGQPD